MDAATRRRVQGRASHRCEYCHIHEGDEPFAFHLEHIIPKKHGGNDGAANPAWSCHSCNFAKGSNLSGLVHGRIVALFNPRRQNWRRHFRWHGAVLVGRTLGPKGARVYRVLVQKKPRRVYIEVREDQLEVLNDA